MNLSNRLLSINPLRLSGLSKRLEFSSVTYSTKPKHSDVDTTSRTQAADPARKALVPSEYRFMYPEFLPDPKLIWRNPIREKLERMDMLNRRAKVNIPEFYVGSVLGVTCSDRHAVGKTSRFVGICILRENCGLRARFILRNVVDQQGVEVAYDLYDPSIQKIELLKLEKRLDDNLLYLRDALPEYSTFSFDMEPDVVPEGTPVPVNPIQVVLRPRPWYDRWERHNLQGVANIEEHTNEKRRLKAEKVATPYEKYDLMKEYRRSIPEEEQNKIFSEVYSQLHQQELANKKMKRKHTFITPKKLA